jgi:hypothetical protein
VSLAESRAGIASRAVVTIGNLGSATWRSVGAEGLQLSYHWLDVLGNAIVWDGPRFALPGPVGPGESADVQVSVVAPRAPGRYLLRFDLVEEHHFWLSELGAAVLDVEVTVAPRIDARRLEVVVHGEPSPRTAAALAAQDEPIVEGDGIAVAHLWSGCEPEPSWSRLMLDAHAEGWTAVGPAVASLGGALERRRSVQMLGAWAPGGRNPRFELPLLLPSLLLGTAPVEHAGLPAYVGDDGLFEGGAVVRLPTRSGRPLH